VVDLPKDLMRCKFDLLSFSHTDSSGFSAHLPILRFLALSP
jgi:hypothetical protein